MAAELDAKKEDILDTLLKVQGEPVDVGGYYHPSEELMAKAMRPSDTLNKILDSIK